MPPAGPPPPSPLQPCNARRQLLFAALYAALWLGAWYSAAIVDRLGVASLWFLPAGLRFALLIALGWRGVAIEFAAQSLLALVQTTPWFGTPPTDPFSWHGFWLVYDWYSALLVNAALVLPLRRWLRDPIDFCEPAQNALFLGAALATCTASAFAGTYGVIRLGNVAASEFAEVFANWLIGDFVAVVTLAPLLLVRVWPRIKRYLQRGRHRRPAAFAAARADRATVATAFVSLLLVFGAPWALHVQPHFPLIALMLLMPLAGIALRYGLRGALLGVALLDAGLVVLIALLDKRGDALPYQVVMIAIAFSGLWLGGMVDGRRKLITRYRDYASVANDLLWETDEHGRLRELGGRLASHIDLSIGQDWRTLLVADEQTQLDEIERAVAAHAPFRQHEIALRGSDGQTLWIQLNGLPLIDETGALSGYRGTAVDVTRARQAEALLRDFNASLRAEVAERTRELRQSHGALLAKERHLEVVLAAVPVGVIELDAEQRCRYINANGCALVGCGTAQAIGRPFLDFVHADERQHVDFVWRINRHSSDVHWLEFRLARTDLRCTAHWIRMPNADEGAGATIVVLTNATARSQQDERLWTLAHHDALTDLPNRHLFWDRARQALLHARRDDGVAALLWIDLDGFKEVNDSLGHAAGDALLSEVASRLKSRMRSSDTVARIGGDEFAVIMPDISGADDAQSAASALLASLAEPFALPQGGAHISCSIGVALYPQHAQTAETLAQCADAAMYIAKKRGKNQIHLADAESAAIA